MKENDLRERLSRFVVDVFRLLVDLKTVKETEVLKYLLSKSAISAGINCQESQAAVSKADFQTRLKYH